MVPQGLQKRGLHDTGLSKALTGERTDMSESAATLGQEEFQNPAAENRQNSYGGGPGADPGNGAP